MSGDQLKDRGNQHFSKREFKEAIDCYTEALKLQPRNHLLLSNRSAAFIKLTMYDKALRDAVDCLAIAPDFARGHLRKASALNGLQRFADALVVAEEGYKLRASDRINKDCVDQWLVATTALFKSEVDKIEDIPQGVSPISQNSLKILSELLRHHNSSGGVSVEVLLRHMVKIVQEVDYILKKFGHVLSSCMSEWVTAFGLCLKIDPRTHSAPKTATEVHKAKLNELVSWLDAEVDHTLYPVLRPIFGLLTTAMLVCAITLSQLIAYRGHIQILTRACLIFYKKSILSTKEYLSLHIQTQQSFLNSFCMESGRARNKASQENEFKEIKCIIQELKSLLSKYDPSSADYNEIRESTDQVVSNASTLLPSSSEISSESFRKLTQHDANVLKDLVATETKKLQTKLNLDENLHFRDMDSLVLSTGLSKVNHINSYIC